VHESNTKEIKVDVMKDEKIDKAKVKIPNTYNFKLDGRKTSIAIDNESK
jgi:hypothetical protein